MSRKFVFHVLAIPHAITSKEYNACAYTNKVYNFCKMMNNRGHTVYHYGCEGSTVECTETINVTTKKQLHERYGIDKYKTTFFEFSCYDDVYKIFTENSINEMRKRVKRYDFILCFFGFAHKSIADNISEFEPTVIVVEPGIGYVDGCFANNLIFESYAVMHYIYGKFQDEYNKWSNTVIPAFFNPDDFEYKENKKDFCLFLSRIIECKGIHIAIQVTQITQKKLIIAGQGDLKDIGYDEIPPHVQVIGYADVETRKQLMADASCLLLPTYYVEPFGCVTIEAMMSGTPVITTDWGAFTENVIHGVTGFRCSMIEQFVWAINNLNQIEPIKCRNWAMNNFSLSRVGNMYEEHFNTLYMYSSQPARYYYSYEDRKHLDNCKRDYNI